MLYILGFSSFICVFYIMSNIIYVISNVFLYCNFKGNFLDVMCLDQFLTGYVVQSK